MKCWLIIALVLILIGFLAIMVAFGLSGWNLSIPKTKQILHSYEVTEDFLDISISSTEADVILLPAEDGVCRVECYENKKMTYAISVSDGTLTISAIDTRAWYDYVHLFSYSSPKITVYLPGEAYSSLTVNGTTGDVTLSDKFSFDAVDINVSTGSVLCQAPSIGSLRIKTSTGSIKINDLATNEIVLTASTGLIRTERVACTGGVTASISTGDLKFTDVVCQSFTSKGNTGDVELENLVASETIQITCTTGDVKFENCDASELFIQTSTGDVEGSLLSPKIFFTESSTGSVNVPHSVAGGACTVSTRTGDIDISIP